MDQSISANEVGVLKEKFKERFNEEPTVIVRAPGRVNLIGEHTDYNDGFVLPIAIDRFITILASPRRDYKVHALSTTYPDISILDLKQHQKGNQQTRPSTGTLRARSITWAAYIEGVAWAMQQRGARLGGANMLISSSIPVGSGLSSSAALEIAAGHVFCLLADITIEHSSLAMICHYAENEFVGARTGIMDQYICALAKSGHSLLIDCRNLNYENIPIRLDEAECAIVVIDSGIKRSHVIGGYNIRRSECEEAIIRINDIWGNHVIKSLRDVTPDLFNKVSPSLSNILRKRVLHVMSENDRTLQTVKALRNNDFSVLRDLMYGSHVSLRDSYEVSVPDVDFLVETAMAQKGCLGARMTGGGFGGCTINIVKKENILSFLENVSIPYKERTRSTNVQSYICRAVDGVVKLSLS